MKDVGRNPHCLSQRVFMAVHNLNAHARFKGKWTVCRNFLGVSIKVFEPDTLKTRMRLIKAYFPFYTLVGDPDRRMVDLIVYKVFRVREFTLVHEGELDFLVSPYYLDGGGTVIDCVARRDMVEDRITREDISLLYPELETGRVTGPANTRR